METQIRKKKIASTAILGIVVNLAVAAAKIILGLAASSLAIMSEGVNNATDAASSFLTLVGTKLSERHPDEKHPFGYGRVEYLTGLVVGILILFTGVSLAKESFDGILHPGEMSVTVMALVIVAATAVVKFFLGNYTIHVGKQTESDALIAVGQECRTDSLFSIVTIASSGLFLATGVSLDAYAGLVFALIVIKAGYEALKSTTSEIIGESGKAELAAKLYKEIRGTEGILRAADMMIHNYGPDRYSGSVNVEIDCRKNVGDVYEFLHELQLKIMHEYHVTMVFGIYAVDEESAEKKELRKVIGEFVRSKEHVESYHALYLSKETGILYVDFTVDYKLRDWEALKEEFLAYMKERYPQYPIELTIETDYV